MDDFSGLQDSIADLEEPVGIFYFFPSVLNPLTGQFSAKGAMQEVPNALAAVTNSTGRDMQMLDSGERTTDSKVFHSVSALYTSDEETKTPATLISWDRKYWKVMSVRYRTHGGFYRAVATLFKQARIQYPDLPEL